MKRFVWSVLFGVVFLAGCDKEGRDCKEESLGKTEENALNANAAKSKDEPNIFNPFKGYRWRPLVGKPEKHPSVANAVKMRVVLENGKEIDCFMVAEELAKIEGPVDGLIPSGDEAPTFAIFIRKHVE